MSTAPVKHMNLELKAIYYCYTNGQKWGKGYTPDEAKKNAFVPAKPSKGLQFVVMAAVLHKPTDDELKNIHDCITADQITGSPKYYDHERTEEDTEQINRLHVGWLTVEKNF